MSDQICKRCGKKTDMPFHTCALKPEGQSELPEMPCSARPIECEIVTLAPEQRRESDAIKAAMTLKPGQKVYARNGTQWLVFAENDAGVMLYNPYGAVTVLPRDAVISKW